MIPKKVVPLLQNQIMSQSQFKREYLGVIVTAENYREIFLTKPTEEFPYKERSALKFHQKHLKAYLAGHPSFIHGYTLNEYGNKIPTVHKVKSKLEEIPLEID